MSMKNFFLEKLDIFDRSDFSLGRQVWEPIYIFCMWAVPAFTFVLWANTYYPEVEFYKSAITEGIGPNLWNAIGSFGLFAFGIAVIFSSFKIPSIIAKQILSNTYAIGCLTFGLLVGQWCLLPFSQLDWWQQGLFGVTSVFLLFIVFVYNFIVWYLSFLILNTQHQKSAFLNKLDKLHWFWRVGLGSFIAVVSFLVFLSG